MNALPRTTPEENADAISDQDRDSLHSLPVMILPVQTAIFRRARIVKNSRLDSVIEFFNGVGCGRGQVDVRGLAKFFNLERVPPHPDVTLLQTVSQLPSFDVYSLRILLRAHDIVLTDVSALTLSPAKVASLSQYMASFTRPLVAEIFGEDTRMNGFADILGSFRGDNPALVRDRLARRADRLGIGIETIPKFLEEYGDIFMSLSYYRQCLDYLLPQIKNFMDGLAMVRASHQLRQDHSLMGMVDKLEAAINGKLSSISGMIESFERSTNDMWRDLAAEKFQRIAALVSSYHTIIGGALCALSVKMQVWSDQFPNASGGVGRRAAFIMSDMVQGLEHFEVSAQEAPMLSALNR